MNRLLKNEIKGFHSPNLYYEGFSFRSWTFADVKSRKHRLAKFCYQSQDTTLYSGQKRMLIVAAMAQAAIACADYVN